MSVALAMTTSNEARILLALSRERVEGEGEETEVRRQQKKKQQQQQQQAVAFKEAIVLSDCCFSHFTFATPPFYLFPTLP